MIGDPITWKGIVILCWLTGLVIRSFSWEKRTKLRSDTWVSYLRPKYFIEDCVKRVSYDIKNRSVRWRTRSIDS